MPQGFIPETPPQLPVTKTVIGENGQVQQIQVDPVTGQQINLAGSGYDAITNGGQGGTGYWSPNVLDEEDGHEPDTTAQEVIRPDEDFQRERASDPRERMTKSQMSGPTNNFGYIDKPGFLGYTSNLPGMPGLIGKGVNAAINTNNAVAMNKARDLMDIDKMGPGQMIGQIAKDKQGQVANVNIGDQSYNVGFEALSPSGQTNLTPNEARQRAGFMGTQITENTPQFAKEEAKNWRQENPELAKQNQGVFSSIFSGISENVRSVVDSLFGGGSKMGVNDFPDAPAAPRGDFSDFGSGNDASEAEADRGDRGVTGGGGGLW